MKRIISAIVLLAMLAAILVGCASDSGTTPATSNSGSSTSSSASASKSETSKPAESDDEPEADASSDESADEGEASGYTPPSEPIVIRTNWNTTGVSDEVREKWHEMNPNVTIEVIGADMSKLMSMIAAGTAPDFLRIYAVTELPFYVTRGIVQSVEPYMYLAEYVDNEEDMVPAQNNYRWDAATATHGEGELYGYIYDFSSDESLVINKTIFEEYGIEVPEAGTALTYSEIGEICKKVQTMENSMPKVMGMTFWDSSFISDGRIQIYNSQAGESPYSDDFSTADYTNPATVEFLEWAIDLIQTGASVGSPIMQPTNNSHSGMFQEGNVAIHMSGYWYWAMMRSNEQTKDHLEDFLCLPHVQHDSYKETGELISYTGAACGTVMLRQTKYPEETFRFLDWWCGGQPAIDRTTTGFSGIPMWKSMIDMLPYETEFDKNSRDTAYMDMEAMTRTLRINPFLGSATNANLLAKYIPPVYNGDDTLENALASLNAELAPLIAEGMEIAGVR